MAWAYDPASRSLLPPHVAVGAGVGAGPQQGSRERQPAAFCTTNFGNFLKVSKDKLTVSYTGSGSHTNDVGAIQADAPAPRATAIAYFEVEVVSVGERGLIGVGFTDASAKLGRQPGWEPGTFGYHGDDGRKYHARGSGEPYGPRFGTGDVVGCGIDWEAREVFFTKNGKYLGAAFRSSAGVVVGPSTRASSSSAAAVSASAAATSAAGALTPTTVTTSSLTSGPLYPTVGLHSRGEKVTANFGAAPFRFDLAGAVAAARARARAAVEAEAAAAMASMSAFSSASAAAASSTDENDDSVGALCLNLVRDFLLTQGFKKTLDALRGETPLPPSLPDAHPARIAADITLSSRAAARRALVADGDVEGARRASARAVSDGGEVFTLEEEQEAGQGAGPASMMAAVAAAAAAEPEVALLLDAQELIESLRKGGRKGTTTEENGGGGGEGDDDDACKEVEAALERAQRSKAFARALSSSSSSSAVDADDHNDTGSGGGGGGGKPPHRPPPPPPPPPPPSHSEFARDVLALAAYPRPQDSPFAGLASRQQRQAAADALNAAMLFHGRQLVEGVEDARSAAAAAAAASTAGGGGGGGSAGKNPPGSSSFPLHPSSSDSWPTSRLERAARQLVAAAAEAHFAGGGAGEPFRLEELVPGGAAEAAAEAAAPLPP